MSHERPSGEPPQHGPAGGPGGQTDLEATRPWPPSQPPGAYSPGPPPPLPPSGGPPPFPSVGGPQSEDRRSPLAAVLAAVAIAAVVALVGWLLFLRPGATPGASPTASPTAVAVDPSPTPGAPGSTPAATAPGTPGASSSGDSPAPSATGIAGPSGSPGPSASPGAASPGPVGTSLPVDPAVEALIREVMAQVPPIRRLEPRADVPFRFISPETFREEITRQLTEANPPEALAAEEATLTRLGLLPPGTDLQSLLIDAYSSSVAAFYEPATGAFTVIAREPFEFGAAERLFVAHEYQHALQDQHFGLERTQVTDPAEGDRALAVLGLIEGDATAVMFDWAQQNLSPDELLGLQDAVTPQDQALLDALPAVIRRQLEFPYLDGFLFTLRLRGLGGSYAPIDDAFARLPVSSEQILHPELYPDEQPVSVTLDAATVTSALGDGWAQLSPASTVGELLMGVWTLDGADPPPGTLPGMPGTPTSTAGWGGDRLLSLEGPDGSWLIVWQTAWDSSTDADEFLAAAEAAMADLPGAHLATRASVAGDLPDPVVVLIADDQATLDQARAGLGVP